MKINIWHRTIILMVFFSLTSCASSPYTEISGPIITNPGSTAKIRFVSVSASAVFGIENTSCGKVDKERSLWVKMQCGFSGCPTGRSIGIPKVSQGFLSKILLNPTSNDETGMIERSYFGEIEIPADEKLNFSFLGNISQTELPTVTTRICDLNVSFVPKSGGLYQAWLMIEKEQCSLNFVEFIKNGDKFIASPVKNVVIVNNFCELNK